MSFAAIIPLTAAILNLALTLFVFTRNTRSTLNRVYALWGISITVWNFGTVMMFHVADRETALLWARFLQFGVIFLPLALLHLCLLMAHISRPRLLRILYVLQLGFAATNFTDLFVSETKNVGYAYYSVGGPMFWAFVTTYGFQTCGALVVLWQSLQSASPLQRARLKSMLWAVSILIAFGNNDLLPILGVYYYPGTQIQIFPFGSLAAIVYGLLVGYSTLQHQLLDIHVAISRIVAHGIRLAFVFFIGLVLMFALWFTAPEQFTFLSFFGSMMILLISAGIASIFFPRLFGQGPDAWERRLLGDRFEYHDQIRSFIASMQWYADTNLLLNDFHDLLENTVGVRRYQIILLDEASQTFSLFRAFPTEAEDKFPQLHADCAVFRYFRESKDEFLGVGVAGATGKHVSATEARSDLKAFAAEFCFPFVSENEPFGLLLVGEKASRDLYTATDITLLASLVKRLSLMINQIRLKTQILHAQELELLGRMSRGMAHDLNNLLTPIWTFLQLSSEGVPAESLSEDLIPVAMRNLKTVRAYIREALFFSENLRPDFQMGRLDLIIREAVDLMAARRDARGIQVVTDAPEEVVVEMDYVLIQRLIGNILANAIDASPPGSIVRVELVRLMKTQAGRDWFRIRVVDAGEGIREEDFSRLMTPYFTTKNRGDEARGFGLGLAICRKIANLHGGNITIASKFKTGTTVQFDLPKRQVEAMTSAAPTLP